VAEPTEPAESPTTAGSATTAESPTTPESAVIATTAVAAATIASTEAREGPETAAVGNDEPGERTQSPVPEPKRSIGRRRRRSGRPEPIEPTVAPVASEMPSPEATEAHPVADEPVADSTSTIPTPPATLVDPKGPAGETLFASSEAHIAVTKGPSIEATASRTVEVDVSAPDDGSEEEIEEVAEVIESMDVSAPEPARPKRTFGQANRSSENESFVTRPVTEGSASQHGYPERPQSLLDHLLCCAAIRAGGAPL
jgi:hypothetical protein